AGRRLGDPGGVADDRRIGIGVVNQKRREIETVEEVVARGRRAIDLLGEARVLLTPDCGFATFADNPVASPEIAEAKLRVIVEAAERLRKASSAPSRGSGRGGSSPSRLRCALCRAVAPHHSSPATGGPGRCPARSGN